MIPDNMIKPFGAVYTDPSKEHQDECCLILKKPDSKQYWSNISSPSCLCERNKFFLATVWYIILFDPYTLALAQGKHGKTFEPLSSNPKHQPGSMRASPSYSDRTVLHWPFIVFTIILIDLD